MSEMKYLSCASEPVELVALAAVPADAPASASVLLIAPTIRMGSAAGKVVVELRYGGLVVHHIEFTLAAGVAFPLPGKWVLNAGYALYFASYVSGATMEAFAVADAADIGNGNSGGHLEYQIPNGAWYVEERIRWRLGCRATYSLDENGMPDAVTYSGKVAVPSQVFRAARQNTSGATITSATPLSPLAFGYPSGEAQEIIISDGPYSTQALAQARIAADYNAVPAKYQLSLNGDSDIRTTWTNEDSSINYYPDSLLITGQYGPGAATTPGSPNIVSEVWPIRDISDDVEAFPDENITGYNFAGTIYEEVYP